MRGKTKRDNISKCIVCLLMFTFCMALLDEVTVVRIKCDSMSHLEGHLKVLLPHNVKSSRQASEPSRPTAWLRCWCVHSQARVPTVHTEKEIAENTAGVFIPRPESQRATQKRKSLRTLISHVVPCSLPVIYLQMFVSGDACIEVFVLCFMPCGLFALVWHIHWKLHFFKM